MEEANLGKRIKKAREKRGMTQQQLADACGIELSYLSYLERGKRTGSVSLINKIAHSLNVTIDYLVNGEIPSYVSENIKEIESYVRYFPEEDIEQITALVKAYRPRFQK